MERRPCGSCDGMCSYEETVGVDLGDAFLRSRAADGFQIKLSAQSGDTLILSVTPDQIQPVLAVIDAYRAGGLAAAQMADLPGAKPTQGLQPAVANQPTLSSPPPAPAAAATVILGAKFADLPAVLANMIGRPEQKGALVAAVDPSSVAQRGALAIGDVLIIYDGKPITGKDDLSAAVHRTLAGSKVDATVIRGGKDTKLSFQF